VIDETVRELARRTNSEVVVLDSVQLAAGEWGHFGKGESPGVSHHGLQFIRNFQLPIRFNYLPILFTFDHIPRHLNPPLDQTGTKKAMQILSLKYLLHRR
jgi:hypothetical protein